MMIDFLSWKEPWFKGGDQPWDWGT